MLTKNIIYAAILCVSLLYRVDANDKKIELEDIEQDNLKSERAKQNINNNAYSQSPEQDYNQQQSTHQYDVEEMNQQDSPAYVYATGSNNYQSAGQQYIEINRGQENSVQPEKYDPNYQNSLEQNVAVDPSVSNYAAVMPMQLVYVQHYDPSPSNHITTYSNQYQQALQVPAYYYPTVQASQDDNTAYVQTKHQYSESEHQEPTSQTTQNYNPHTNYVAVQNPVQQIIHVEQIPGYLLSSQYQSQHEVVPEEQDKQPQYVQNYVNYEQQAYTSAVPHEQQIKYVQSPVQSKFQIAHPTPIPSRPSSLLQNERAPKVLPQYAHAVSRPVYSHISGNLVQDHSEQSNKGNNIVQSQYKPSPTVSNSIHNQIKYGQFVHRKPNSLLESYIPSSIQIEYLKRGLSKEPLSTYDTIAYSRGFPAKNFERGFLPNQMYPTAGGGVTFGHFKRDTRKETN